MRAVHQAEVAPTSLKERAASSAPYDEPTAAPRGCGKKGKPGGDPASETKPLAFSPVNQKGSMPTKKNATSLTSRRAAQEKDPLESSVPVLCTSNTAVPTRGPHRAWQGPRPPEPDLPFLGRSHSRRHEETQEGSERDAVKVRFGRLC